MKKNKLDTVRLENVNITDKFWKQYIDLVDDVILPFQWNLINDKVDGAEKSYCIQNFRIAAGEEAGKHQGMVFQDTDVAKWLEAVAYSLAKTKNPELETLADQAIDLIAKAQAKDGYINTYYQITGETRWENLFEGHELYTAGHMIEAAVAYYEATGKDKFLKVVSKFADYIDTVFGRAEGKLQGYPGHPEIELALMKLYYATEQKQYLELAYYFVTERGQEPSYFLQEKGKKDNKFIFPEFKDFDLDYAQAHLPMEKQETAEGHAVRAVYLYSAMAELAYEKQDEMMLKQCERLWENIVRKRMYITGSIGSASYGERFTSDYDLPNNTNYSESCATIGLAMFSNRMFQITKDGKYMDIVEKALYNTLLAGLSVDGKHFFYVNPLEMIPDVVNKNPTMNHVKTTRQLWFGVACCPPNIARTLASISNYSYACDKKTLYINLFIASAIKTEILGEEISITLHANYPESGNIRLTIHNEMLNRQPYTIALRQPSFSKNIVVKVNGKCVDYIYDKGYVYITREWRKKDEIEIELDVDFRFVYSNAKVRDNIGKVSLMKGPWVYCLEEEDNGKYLSSIRINPKFQVEKIYNNSMLDGVLCAKLKGERIQYDDISNLLYIEEKPRYIDDTFTAIPYCFWNNRSEGEMIVWMHEK